MKQLLFEEKLPDPQPKKPNSDTIPATERYPKNWRIDSDFYPTPSYVTEALFEREKFDGIVLEPASGFGDMSRVIEKYNECISSDIRNDLEVYGKRGVDFLKITEKYDNVITNAPFRLANDFVLQSKKVATKKIAIILSIGFLEGAKRYNILTDKEFLLKKLLIFSRRVKFINSTTAPISAVAWYIWDKEYTGAPTIEWIKPDINPKGRKIIYDKVL